MLIIVTFRVAADRGQFAHFFTLNALANFLHIYYYKFILQQINTIDQLISQQLQVFYLLFSLLWGFGVLGFWGFA